MTTTTTATPRVTAANAYDIFVEAFEAGRQAAESAIPTAMVVGTAKSILSDQIDQTKQTWVVSEGMCGFAYVTIRPARGPMVTLLKARGIGWRGHYGGWQCSATDFGSPRSSQSYERAMAAADAAAGVLTKYGITAYADGRLD